MSGSDVVASVDGEMKLDARKLDVSGRPPVTAETILAAQKKALELVLQGAPVETVLAELVRIVEDSAPDSAVAAILILNSKGRLRTVAAPGLPESFNAAIDSLEANELGAFGVAAATGITAVTQDIAADPNWTALKPLAEELGLKAAWSQPIISRDSRVLGAFGTYFRERRRPSAFELRLVETLSQTAALAIARHESEAAMARQRRTLDLAMEAAEMGSWRYTVADNICLYDERSQRLYGLSDGRFLHSEEGVKNMFHPDDLAPMWKAVGIAVDPKGDGRYDVEYRARQPDGSWRWLSAWGIVEFEGEGADRRPVAIAGSSRDITRAKLAEEHQRLLVNELNHRVKNTLATVHSIVHHTLRSTEDVAEMRHVVEFRIQSLARAHDLLTTQNWAGAEITEVVALATEPFPTAQLDSGGPSVQLSPQQALALAMALHELGTNAVKYGALAQSSGRVQLSWRVEGDALSFTWREHGGHPVKPPSRRGFGSRLLEKAVALDLGGTARLEWAVDGVVWQATASLQDAESG